jgi:TrmH family RNA methyltransferase
MITAAIAKRIKALKDKKERTEQQLFIVEGEKMVLELMNAPYSIAHIFATEAFLTSLPHNLRQQFDAVIEQVTHKELSRLSLLTQANSVLAVVQMPHTGSTAFNDDITLAFENISDPGNFGSIIRIADWFGIRHIVCSPSSVDLYNPKVVQASMGSLFRIHVLFTPLTDYITTAKNNHHASVFAAGLAGNSVYACTKKTPCILLFGNESKGLSKEVLSLADQIITIPSFNLPLQKYVAAESLNVAMSAAIICNEWRRK